MSRDNVAKKKVPRKARVGGRSKRAIVPVGAARKSTSRAPSKKKVTRKGRGETRRKSSRVAPRRVVSSRPPIKKKVAKRASTKRVVVRSKRPVGRVARAKRLVRKPSHPIPRPPLNADRNERTALKHALDVIRRHVKGYEGGDGYRLADVARFSKVRQRALLKKSALIKELLASPHDIIRPKNDRDKRAIRPFARKQLRGARHYIVHKPDDGSQVRLEKGRVHITRKRGRVEFDSIYFMFPHSPYDEDDAVEMIEDMLPDMPDGYYILQTGAHGDTGEPVHRDKILDQMRAYMNAYQNVNAEVTYEDPESGEMRRYNKVVSQGFTESMAGYRFASTTLDGVLVEQASIDVRRQAQKDHNEKLRREHLTRDEKFAAQEQWRAKRARRKRKVAAKKAAVTRRKGTQVHGKDAAKPSARGPVRKAAKKAVIPIRVAPKKLRRKKKAARKK